MGTGMATTKITFTLDNLAVRRPQDAAERLAVPKSQVVGEAILEFCDRIGRLSERERSAMLRTFDQVVPKIPARSVREAERELAEVRRARRSGRAKTSGGRRTSSNG